MKRITDRDLVVIANLHCKNKDELKEYALMAKELGVDVIGGSLMDYNGSSRLSEAKRRAINIGMVGSMAGLPVVLDAVGDSDQDGLTDSHYVNQHSDVIRVPSSVLEEGNYGILNELSQNQKAGLKGGIAKSKPLIIGLPENYSDNLVSQVLLLGNVNFSLSPDNITYDSASNLRARSNNPVYLDGGCVLYSDNLAYDVKDAMHFGIGGVIMDVPIAESGIRPLEDIMGEINTLRSEYN